MTENYATWEGADTALVVAGVGGIKIAENPIMSNSNQLLKLSQSRPIGIMIENHYDYNGRFVTTRDAAVFYKGQNVEVLPATLLNNPQIKQLEERLSGFTDYSGEIPGVIYEKPPSIKASNYLTSIIKQKHDVIQLRKKKLAAKPKRKLCSCKKK